MPSHRCIRFRPRRTDCGEGSPADSAGGKVDLLRRYGRVPYGGRSKETLLKYARQDVRFLRSFDLKAIVIACGTVSTTSLDTLQAENDLPIVGVVEPTCRRALLVTKNKKVGIIATLASIRSGAYEAALRRLDRRWRSSESPAPCLSRWWKTAESAGATW